MRKMINDARANQNVDDAGSIRRHERDGGSTNCTMLAAYGVMNEMEAALIAHGEVDLSADTRCDDAVFFADDIRNEGLLWSD